MPDSAGASGPGKLAVLNVKSGRIESTVNAGFFPSAMRVAGRTLYMSLVGEHKLLAYDLSGGQPRLRRANATGRAPQNLCADDARVYVVNSGSDDVSAVSLTSDSFADRGLRAVWHASPTGGAAAAQPCWNQVVFQSV